MISLKDYEDYTEKIGDRYNLYKLLNDNFSIKKVIYPGSYIEITPSFFFPITVYIDNDKNAKKFFENKDLIKEYISKKKIYDEEVKIRYFSNDYRKIFNELVGNFDLLISLYAGFVSKYCKSLLKKQGFLLVNNSHGDASMAYLDDDYELFGIINYRNQKYSLNRKNLHEYFVPKKDNKITKEVLEKTMRGIGYVKSANYYLFVKRKKEGFNRVRGK